MEKCCVCSNSITDPDPAVLLVDQSGKDRYICGRCEKQLETAMSGRDFEETQSAVHYLSTYLDKLTNDPEIHSYITNVLRNIPCVEEAQGTTPNNSGHESGSVWIDGMRAISWIVFIGIIIAGIVLAFRYGSYATGLALLAVAASVAIAFLCVAMMMIFLGMAQDMSEIKNLLKKNSVNR